MSGAAKDRLESIKKRILSQLRILGLYLGCLGVFYLFQFFGVHIYQSEVWTLTDWIFLGIIFVYFLFALGVGSLLKSWVERRKKIPENLSPNYYLHNVNNYVLSIVSFIIAILFILDFFEFTEFKYIKLFLGINLMILPYPSQVVPIFSNKEKIEAEFQLLEKDFEDYPKRQKWLIKIFKRVESLLRTGYIHGSYSTLVYHFNVEEKKYDEVAYYLYKVKNALIDEHNGTELISNLRILCPGIAFTSFRRKPVIPLINDLFKTYKNFFAFLVLFLIFILDPKTTLEYLLELFSFLK